MFCGMKTLKKNIKTQICWNYYCFFIRLDKEENFRLNILFLRLIEANVRM